ACGGACVEEAAASFATRAQGERVGHAIPVKCGKNERAVEVVVDAEVSAQRPHVEAVFLESGSERNVGRIILVRDPLLASKDVADHKINVAGPYGLGDIAQLERSRLHAERIDLLAVDEDLDLRRHADLTDDVLL